MKIRALVVIDLDVEDFREAGAEQKKLQDSIDTLVEDNKLVLWHGVDVRERRGKLGVDFKKYKFRSN